MNPSRVFLALVLLCVLPAGAQFSGRITGMVVDATGAAVPGAEVRLLLARGSKALLSTKTGGDGTYHFIAVRAAEYDISVEAPGFVKAALRGVAVDPARETSVPDIRLELATVSQTLEVTATVTGVETSNAEVSDTVTMEQIRKLPVLDRDPLALIQTQPGVVSNGNSYTVINGMRTSYSNMTLDGVNIQDNYIRDNALDYTPNTLLLGQVRQLTLVTSNQNSAASGGSSQVAFATPSGTDEFHGEVLWYNRNSFFSANDWFNNQGGAGRPFLNQNQFGGSAGGPIRKDKLFFYGSYEAVRTRQQQPVTQTILTPDARSGIFTYRDSSRNVRKVDLLALRHITIDPVLRGLLAQVPGPENINNYTAGDSSPGNLRNTAGYRFNQRGNRDRDNVTARFDYNLSPSQVLSASYLWNRDDLDRPDASNDFSPIPKVSNPNHSNFLSASWRWTPGASLTNELRGGFNLTTGDFLTSQQFGPYILTNLVFSDPVNEFLPQGRNTNTYVISDDAAYQRGRHYIQFGFHMQRITARAYDAVGTVPTYTLDLGQGQAGLTTRDLPGARASDLATATSLLATLGGYIDSYSQTFNVTSRTSGYVAGAANVRNLNTGEYDWYIQDNWKIRPRLTATIGLRYELPRVTDERDSLELLPRIQNGGAVGTLLSNATLDFAGRSAGRPWYNRPKRDFGPNVGLAWDPFGKGTTSIRAGYSLSYVNDQALLAPQSSTEANVGLVGISSDFGLSSRVATGVPKIQAPDYRIPRTVLDNYLDDPSNTVGLIDPNLRTPYVQQWSVGIQHEWRQAVFEARYVANHSVGGYRNFDFNQVIIQQNGFLADFLRAQSNAALAQGNPAYNPSIAGSQPLPVFNQLSRGGQLSSAQVRNLILTGQVADLAYRYAVNGQNGTVQFFPNPYALGTDLLTNFSSSSYDSLQLQVRRRSKNGLDVQANYTFAKVLSDAAGDSQSRIEHFLDLANPRIERARANFDLAHMIKANAIWELPFGKGHRLDARPLEKVIGGWSLGGILTWQSGAPFSILSQRGTLNRSSGSRSQYNTAVTSLTKSQLDSIVSYQMTGNGPFIIAPSAINPSDGTGVNTDGQAAFSGQVFLNPAAGNIGTLQRRMFSGPWTFDLDASIQKTVRIAEHQSLELRMEGVNVLNHATFWPGDQNINSTTFGAMNAMFYSPRIMQFGLYYRW